MIKFWTFWLQDFRFKNAEKKQQIHFLRYSTMGKIICPQTGVTKNKIESSNYALILKGNKFRVLDFFVSNWVESNQQKGMFTH